MNQHSVMVNLILKAEDQPAATAHVYAILTGWMMETRDAPFPDGSLLFFAEHKCEGPVCEYLECDHKADPESLFCEHHDLYELDHSEHESASDDPYVEHAAPDEGCVNCGSPNVAYAEMPSMMGYGEDWSLECPDCGRLEVGSPESHSVRKPGEEQLPLVKNDPREVKAYKGSPPIYDHTEEGWSGVK